MPLPAIGAAAVGAGLVLRNVVATVEAVDTAVGLVQDTVDLLNTVTGGMSIQLGEVHGAMGDSFTEGDRAVLMAVQTQVNPAPAGAGVSTLGDQVYYTAAQLNEFLKSSTNGIYSAVTAVQLNQAITAAADNAAAALEVGDSIQAAITLLVNSLPRYTLDTAGVTLFLSDLAALAVQGDGPIVKYMEPSTGKVSVCVNPTFFTFKAGDGEYYPITSGLLSSVLNLLNLYPR